MQTRKRRKFQSIGNKFHFQYLWKWTNDISNKYMSIAHRPVFKLAFHAVCNSSKGRHRQEPKTSAGATAALVMRSIYIFHSNYICLGTRAFARDFINGGANNNNDRRCTTSLSHTHIHLRMSTNKRNWRMEEQYKANRKQFIWRGNFQTQTFHTHTHTPAGYDSAD